MNKIEDSLEKAVRVRSGPLPATERDIPPAPNLKVYFEDEDKQPHLSDYIEILIRRKWIVLAFLVFVFITAMLASFLMDPVYQSTATLQIRNVSPNITKEFYLESLSADDYDETQYKILNSRNLAERVITTLNTKRVPELLDRSMLVSSEYTDISSEVLMKELVVEPVKKSQLVNVSFESPDPVMAALVANTVADEYIAYTLENRLNPTQEAKRRLEKEVAEMKARLEASEEQLNRYITKNQIYLISKDNVYDNSISERISALSRELNTAVAERISKESVYQEISKAGVDYSVIIQDPLIQSLTRDYIKLETDYFNLLQIHKPQYPRMVRLNEQIDALKKRIETEEQKKINTLSSDYRLALKKENYLSSAIEKLRREAALLQDKVVQIQILKRDVDTNSELYYGLLQRLKEVGVSAALAESNVQVLDRARVPGSPFRPKKAVNAALAVILGLFGGAFIAFLVEYFDRSVKTPDDIVKRSSLPVLGMVPVSKVNPREITYVRSNNNDLFTEAFRSLGAYLRFTKDSNLPKQILVTSPLPGEGKTLLSVNTAKSLAGFLGNGIIVDVDFRRPNVHTLLNLDNSRGLSTFLSGFTGFDETIRKSSIKGLDVITSGPMPPNPFELLNSSRMKDLINTLSATYNYVIIDSPPILGLSDSLILSAFVESVIVVVRAGSTPGDALTQTYRALDGVKANVLGVLINGVGAGSKYGYTYYHKAYLPGRPEKGTPAEQI
ncbi:MAG: polysaccharide biosynthesis tyrosine autokinase [Nitrospirae bacterium]|nr:polysaccharide biosynthesis tyrosine autokinase [Nitrospirota bacterium]